MPELFHRLPRNIAAIFSGRNLLWHALAIVLTVVILKSDFDWYYYVATRGDMFRRIAFPAVILGTFVPVFGILATLMVGELTKNRRTITTAWALGQAAILGYLVSCLYKAFTGRIPPPFAGRFRNPDAVGSPLIDSSHGFQLGLLKGGVFWGWPSSHTTIAFATAVCLVVLHPKNKLFVLCVLLYALYIGLGVSVTIHWFSEFVAGAIIGSVVGSVVGRGFRTKPA